MNPKNFNDDNRIEKWEDALKLYDSFVQSGRQWIFRGLADASGHEFVDPDASAVPAAAVETFAHPHSAHRLP